jgi:hypothetical protein
MVVRRREERETFSIRDIGKGRNVIIVQRNKLWYDDTS